MKKTNIQELESRHGINRLDYAGFLLVISSMDDGDQISTNIGRLEKVGEDQFKICCDEETIKGAVEEWLNDRKPESIL